MSNSYFELNREKIRETLLYIAARVKNPTLHTVFKIMYFADKLHLSNYGRFITGDTYYAMEYGPVPSAAYDMTKDAEFHALNGIKITGYHLKPLRKANIGVLSESDTECLDQAIAQYGHMTFGQLTDASHDEAWHRAPENGEISVNDIVKTLENPEELLVYLQDQHP